MTEVVTGRPAIAVDRQAAEPGTRGRKQWALWRIGGQLDTGWRVGLSLAGVALVLLAWSLAAAQAANPALFPTPLAAARALGNLWSDGSLRSDMWASGQRILIGYGLSVAFGVVFGILIGSFPSAEAFFEVQIGFLRYIPASALSPVFLLWLGIGESPKIWLVVVGSVFFNILMIADVARAVPRELVTPPTPLAPADGPWCAG